MNFYLQIRSAMTEESLIISDEYETNVAAARYRNLLIVALFDRIRFASLEHVSTWMEKAFAIEIIQAESHPNIQTKEVCDTSKSIDEDVDRVIEFMDHTVSELETQSLQEEFDFLVENQA